MKKALKVILALAVAATMTASAMFAVSADTDDAAPATDPVASDVLTVGAIAETEPAAQTTAPAAQTTAPAARPTAPVTVPRTGDNGLAVAAIAGIVSLGAAAVVIKKKN